MSAKDKKAEKGKDAPKKNGGKGKAAKPEKKTEAPVSEASGFGLESLSGLDKLLAAPEEGEISTGKPVQVSVSQIDEDPNQPRTIFDESGLKELAETIKERGVKTPISIRIHPENADRYIVNHGARRLRASILAGLATIPAFIDEDYNRVDQVIENLQRDNLTPMEIAEFIKSELEKGAKQKDVAKAIGKSTAYVNQHVTLLKLPEVLRELYDTGRCQDVTLLNELSKIHKAHPNELAKWCKTNEINRASVKAFKDFLEHKQQKTQPQTDAPTQGPEETTGAGEGAEAPESAGTPAEQQQEGSAEAPEQPQGEAALAHDADTDREPQEFAGAGDAPASPSVFPTGQGYSAPAQEQTGEPDEPQDASKPVVPLAPEAIIPGQVEIHVFVIEDRAANTTKEGTIILDKVPAKKEKVWILFQDGKKTQVPVSKVTITQVKAKE